jgi:hypothetical protein
VDAPRPLDVPGLRQPCQVRGQARDHLAPRPVGPSLVPCPPSLAAPFPLRGSPSFVADSAPARLPASPSFTSSFEFVLPGQLSVFLPGSGATASCTLARHGRGCTIRSDWRLEEVDVTPSEMKELEAMMEKLLAKLPPEQRVAGLSPEEILLALPDEILCLFPDEAFGKLAEPARNAIRARIGR